MFDNVMQLVAEMRNQAKTKKIFLFRIIFVIVLNAMGINVKDSKMAVLGKKSKILNLIAVAAFSYHKFIKQPVKESTETKTGKKKKNKCSCACI